MPHLGLPLLRALKQNWGVGTINPALAVQPTWECHLQLMRGVQQSVAIVSKSRPIFTRSLIRLSVFSLRKQGAAKKLCPHSYCMTPHPDLDSGHTDTRHNKCLPFQLPLPISQSPSLVPETDQPTIDGSALPSPGHRYHYSRLTQT